MFIIKIIISIVAVTNLSLNIETKSTAKPLFKKAKRESISYFNFKNSLMFELVEDVKRKYILCFKKNNFE